MSPRDDVDELKVVGDQVTFLGWPVATLSPAPPPSVRDRFVALLRYRAADAPPEDG